MAENKLDLFLIAHADKFTPYQLNELKSRLKDLDENQLQRILSLDYKSPTTILIISILVGGWGVDRFMLGEAGLGIVKLLTCGGLGIWAIIDWFTAQSRAKDYNYKLINSVL